MAMLNPTRKEVVLMNRDGVSLTATILSSFPNDADCDFATIDEDDDHHDDKDNDTSDHSSTSRIVILTIALNRHHEKNVINPRMISLLTQALDIIDSHPSVTNTYDKALIITGLSSSNGKSDEGGSSKFFSNGLDLQWMRHASASTDVSKMIESFNAQVLARILILPFRTIAAINGHCIGAGLFLALACDYRIMRTERGYLQWPEARLGMRLTKGFMELSKAKIRADDVLREGILTAKRYSPNEALASRIIDAMYPMEELFSRACQLAIAGMPMFPKGMNLEHFNPEAYSVLKIEMYTDAYRALTLGKIDDLPHSKI